MEYLKKINDLIPEIFKDIIQKYNFKCKQHSSLKTVLYKDNYIITMLVEREYVDLYFIKEEGDIINKYWIQPFVLQNLTEEDKSNTREGDDWETRLINYLVIYEKVLRTKWESILLGKMDWVEEYKKSKMPSIREFCEKEYVTYKDYFDEMKGKLIDYTPFIDEFFTSEIKEKYEIKSISKDSACWVNGVLVPNFLIVLKKIIDEVKYNEIIELFVNSYKNYFMTNDAPGVSILNAAKYVLRYKDKWYHLCVAKDPFDRNFVDYEIYEITQEGYYGMLYDRYALYHPEYDKKLIKRINYMDSAVENIYNEIWRNGFTEKILVMILE